MATFSTLHEWCLEHSKLCHEHKRISISILQSEIILQASLRWNAVLPAAKNIWKNFISGHECMGVGKKRYHLLLQYFICTATFRKWRWLNHSSVPFTRHNLLKSPINGEIFFFPSTNAPILFPSFRESKIGVNCNSNKLCCHRTLGGHIACPALLVSV